MVFLNSILVEVLNTALKQEMIIVRNFKFLSYI